MQDLNWKLARRWLFASVAGVLAACATPADTGGKTTAAAPAASAKSASSAKTAWPTPKDVAAKPAAFTPEGIAALDARMKESVDKGQVAGVITLFAKDGQLADYKIYGVQTLGDPTPMSESTIFRIRSMTKPVTGVAMMQLYEQGKWKLDDPITKFVPELANLQVMTGVDPNDPKKLITVPVKRPATMKELMTHTAGFGYGISAGNPVDAMFAADHPMSKADLKALTKRVAEIPLLAQPGDKWSYSIAVDIQGLIVERISGEKFGDYLKNHIFTPLGMSKTSFVLAEADRKNFATVYEYDRATSKLKVFPDTPWGDFFKSDHAESGGGGLASTAHDYARFAQMLVNGGELDGKRIIKAESVALMAQDHISKDFSVFAPPKAMGFGLDFAVVRDPAVARTAMPAGSFWWFGIDGSWFWIDPTNKLWFVGMIQRRGGAGPGSVDFRGDSAKLVYDALKNRVL